MPPQWVRLWVMVMLAVVQSGCAGMLRGVAEEVTPAVISSAVDELADPKTQTQIVAAIDEERVKILSARLSAGLVDGMLNTLEDPARRARLEALLAGLAAKTAGTVVDTMFARILDEEVQARMRLTLRLTVTDLITAVVTHPPAERGAF